MVKKQVIGKMCILVDLEIRQIVAARSGRAFAAKTTELLNISRSTIFIVTITQNMEKYDEYRVRVSKFQR